MRSIECDTRFWGGFGLAVAGALTLLGNAVFTPLLNPDASFAETASSSVFLWRQSVSALAALLLLPGCLALYLRQADRTGLASAGAFVLTFFGSAALFAHEWSQVFVIHDIALRAAGALETIDAAEGPSLLDVGAMIAFVTFVLGWIAFSISLLRAGSGKRVGPILVIVGLFATPILGAALSVAWGAVIGNAVLGSGWIVLAGELAISGPASEASL